MPKINEATDTDLKVIEELMKLGWKRDDARKVRAENSIAIAMLNDQDKEISPETIHALKAYDIETLLWSKRDNYVQKLAA